MTIQVLILTDCVPGNPGLELFAVSDGENVILTPIIRNQPDDIHSPPSGSISAIEFTSEEIEEIRALIKVSEVK